MVDTPVDKHAAYADTGIDESRSHENRKQGARAGMIVCNRVAGSRKPWVSRLPES